MLLPAEGDFRYGDDRKLLNQVTLQYIADVTTIGRSLLAILPADASDKTGGESCSTMHNRLAQEMGAHWRKLPE